MLDKMKQLMEVKRQAEQLKRELDTTQIEVQEVPGIKIVITGAQSFLSVDIDEQLLAAENKTRTENAILQSLNAAIKKSQQVATQKMKAMTGLNIPGL